MVDGLMLDGGIQVDGVYDDADLQSEWKKQCFIGVLGSRYGMKWPKL